MKYHNLFEQNVEQKALICIYWLHNAVCSQDQSSHMQTKYKGESCCNINIIAKISFLKKNTPALLTCL